MIELYDAAVLEPRRERSAAVFALALAIGAGALSAYAFTLHDQWRQIEGMKAQLQSQLRERPAKPAASATLLADLERQALALETRLAEAQAEGSTALRPSAWLQRLSSLSAPGALDVSLVRVDIERNGSARLEGLAGNAAAISRYVQAFSAQEAPAELRARSIELRQDKAQAPYLRFTLRANAPGAPGAPSAGAPHPAPVIEAAASASPTAPAANATRVAVKQP